MKKTTRKTLQFYWEQAVRYKRTVFATIFSVTVVAFLQAVIPLYFKRFIDLIAGSAPVTAHISEFILILFIIAGLELIQWSFRRISDFSVSYFASHIMADLTDMCFAYLHKHSFTFFDNSFGGSLVKKVKWFANAFETIADRIIFDIMPLVLSIGFIVIILAQRNIWLGLGVIVWAIIFIGINTVFSNWKLEYDIKRNEAETHATGLLADTITNHSVLRLFNGYARESRRFEEENAGVQRLRIFTWNLNNIFEAIQGFLAIILEIGIMMYAVFLWRRGVLTIGDFFLIQTYLVNIIMHIWDFGRILRNVYERLSDAEEMTVILTTPHEIKDVPSAKELVVQHGEIVFDRVDFLYHQTRKVLDGFSLTIRAHEHVALIGSSGAGKTTIVKALLRMHDLDGGKIKIDGQNIAHVTQESLWRAISLVPQDPTLFHRSLMENIRYGRPEASDEEVIEASKKARCHDFISDFPEGYNTYVGERGVKLSGGERQRVAIARAILRNSPILVFDEATSSLDSESEIQIQEALTNLMHEKTVVVIAHRLSTIRKMDRIIVIENGKVVDDGSHDELMHKEGIYKKLWSIQAGGFI